MITKSELWNYLWKDLEDPLRNNVVFLRHLPTHRFLWLPLCTAITDGIESQCMDQIKSDLRAKFHNSYNTKTNLWIAISSLRVTKKIEKYRKSLLFSF